VWDWLKSEWQQFQAARHLVGAFAFASVVVAAAAVEHGW
jgi:hypothetical protein